MLNCKTKIFRRYFKNKINWDLVFWYIYVYKFIYLKLFFNKTFISDYSFD